MCWSLEASAISAVGAWFVCVYLYWRNLNFDRWAALYLFTFTLTQLIDVALWLDEGRVGLSTCSNVNYGISKFVIPSVVFIQHMAQCQYPSKVFKKYRNLIAWAHALPVLGMAYQFHCTSLVDTPHGISLCWGGHIAESYQILIHVGVIMLFFYFVMPFRVGVAHITILGGVMTYLYHHDGTLALGSRWCSYCLIYSVAYLTSPYWIEKNDIEKMSQQKIK